jgi:hypothetical protein
MESGSEISSQSLATSLLSPLKSLTTEFGMGSGRTSALKPPGDKYIVFLKKYQVASKSHIAILPE